MKLCMLKVMEMRESKIRKVVQLTKNIMTISIGKTSVVYWLSVGHWCFGQLWFFFIEIKQDHVYRWRYRLTLWTNILTSIQSTYQVIISQQLVNI